MILSGEGAPPPSKRGAPARKRGVPVASRAPPVASGAPPVARVRWDAGRRDLSYDLAQSPEQAGTQSLGGRRAAQAGRQGGTAKLRKCAVFVDGGHGCTCGDYRPWPAAPRKACCKCVASGSSTPSTDNMWGTCRMPEGPPEGL